MNVLSAPRERRHRLGDVLGSWAVCIVAAWLVLFGLVLGVYELLTWVWP